MTDEVYQSFYIMEIEMKKKLSCGSDNIIVDVLKNEDLLFQCFCIK